MTEPSSLGDDRCTGFGDCGCDSCFPAEIDYPLADHSQIERFHAIRWRWRYFIQWRLIGRKGPL